MIRPSLSASYSFIIAPDSRSLSTMVVLISRLERSSSAVETVACLMSPAGPLAMAVTFSGFGLV